jgi:GH24 family phage-related lysozyme (muramidase)
LNKLNEEELRELNRRVVARLNLLHKARQIKSLAKFNIGDRAYFTNDGQKVFGIITRLNQRSVSFVTEDGRRWTISPALLTLVG